MSLDNCCSGEHKASSEQYVALIPGEGEGVREGCSRGQPDQLQLHHHLVQQLQVDQTT